MSAKQSATAAPVAWAEFHQQCQLVHDYQSMLAVAGLYAFRCNLAADWVQLSGEIFSFDRFLEHIAPNHRKTVHAQITHCAQTGEPVNILFDAHIGHTSTWSAYALRIHAPDNVVLGLCYLAFNGLPVPDGVQLADWAAAAASQRTMPMPSLVVGSAASGPALDKPETVNTPASKQNDQLARLFSTSSQASSGNIADVSVKATSRQLLLHYQPQASIGPHRIITGFEAFLRKWDPQRGLLAPDKFLAEMEASGELTEVTEWLVTESLTHLAECQQLAHRPLRLTLNLASSQLLNANFIEHLSSLIETRWPALLNCVALDIPLPMLARSYQLEDWLRLETLMGEMVDLGFSPILEGYGYPDMLLPPQIKNHLLTKASEVKVNVSHFRGLDFNTCLGTIIKEIEPFQVTLAAHGVEDADTLQTIRFMHVQTYQGNLLAAPMPFENLRDFVTAS